MPDPVEPASPRVTLAAWARELVELYESGAANQFILHGNVHDRLLLPLDERPELGTLGDFLLRVLMPRFDVVLSYDLGNGIRVLKGEQAFGEWPRLREGRELPSPPRQAIGALTHYFRYCANLARLGRQRLQVALIVHGAQLVAPAWESGLSYDLGAVAVLVREWSSSPELTEQALATFLMTDTLNDLHPLLANNTRAARIPVPLPTPPELLAALELMAPAHPKAFEGAGADMKAAAQLLTGATLGAIEGLVKRKHHGGVPLALADLVTLKRRMVENDCNGLIEFVEPERTLTDFEGQERVKAWLRQDVALWRQSDVQAIPMGYLICGPVGTGKTYLVECLAGEAGVPVVKLKNFRDRWVGSTEGNLERIFRLLHALERCFVFIDEADQALGKREAGPGDSGLSGRVYSMMAEEMGSRRNRGRIVWILASSRPDLIEVDLKRPGRIDVKIPIFPTTSPREGFQLIKALCGKRGVEIPASAFTELERRIPPFLTPGAAESLAVWLYRIMRTEGRPPLDALIERLADYQSPVPRDVMDFQIQVAVREASDLEFVPPIFRDRVSPGPGGQRLPNAGQPS